MADFNMVKGVKLGIVFAGGGARGYGLVGAIKAFEEAGICPDFICGTSVGSLIGAAWASGKAYEEIYKTAEEIKKRDIRTSKIFFIPSKTTGLIEVARTAIGGDKLFSELKVPFAAVATELNTGKEKVFESGRVANCVAASCAAPGFFAPVEIGNNNYVDGGLLNNLPASVARAKKCDIVIAVDINSTRGGGTESSKVIDVVSTSIKIALAANVKMGYRFADFIIKPDLSKYSATKLDGFQEMVDLGYSATMEMLPEICAVLSSKRAIKKLNKTRNKAERAAHKAVSVFEILRAKHKLEQGNKDAKKEKLV